MKADELKSVKITAETLKKLRFIKALKGETFIIILGRLVNKEFEEIKREVRDELDILDINMPPAGLAARQEA